MTTVHPTTYTLSLYDGDDANGVANILATLLEQNLHNHPERLALARTFTRPVAVFSTDTNAAATIIFRDDHATVCNDFVNNPAVVVWATVGQILDVSQLEMKAGGLLPVGFFTRRGLGVLRDIATHKLVVQGLLTHPVTALRMIAMLSVAS
ncbi:MULTISPECIES: hypothetical protein [unclassified Rhodococcus (in: high G+C Gram-positive bacteria)]|uniref:hypothetical protein n=1 Tax=unclassified Rhodococcus (in: high G+C Gram-positive bacteria) TaxID=192944 RepID=UPI00163A2D61|nr:MULTISPECIES: hypothetical protein [unclassified Rhodococcus (in: high G+C Gram-positive bacteria)]MBC2637874.1 hypothetical protein [Rhodococcus sp. 3A]MBC2897378.1 hypothetical protein [Rhodococcus sp. 4CII]